MPRRSDRLFAANRTPSPPCSPSSSSASLPPPTPQKIALASRGWSASADDRPEGTPLLSFANDFTKLSPTLFECVAAVNLFTESPLFKRMVHLLLGRSREALGLRLELDHGLLDADYLHSAITKKLQLLITAQPSDPQHIMETSPATGEVRIDDELLTHLLTIPQPPHTPGATESTDEAAVNHRAIKALCMVKLLHEVAHQHTLGLMSLIRDTCDAANKSKVTDDAPEKLCWYWHVDADEGEDEEKKQDQPSKQGDPSNNTPKPRSRRRSTPKSSTDNTTRRPGSTRYKRGEMGWALENILLGDCVLHMPPRTPYGQLTTLLAERDRVCYHISALSIPRLQPECFTGKCNNVQAFKVNLAAKQSNSNKRRKVTRHPSVRSADKTGGSDDRPGRQIAVDSEEEEDAMPSDSEDWDDGEDESGEESDEASVVSSSVGGSDKPNFWKYGGTWDVRQWRTERHWPHIKA